MLAPAGASLRRCLAKFGGASLHAYSADAYKRALSVVHGLFKPHTAESTCSPTGDSAGTLRGDSVEQSRSELLRDNAGR